MSRGWRVGDLAESIPNVPGCPTCNGPVTNADFAGPMLVIDISYLAWATETCGLHFIGVTPPLCSCGFRKVKPPEADAFDREVIAALADQPEQVPA